ncbi:DUF2484 family protein [Jannaschia sp. M317]|uniref:DUF2484 family protein n=1 Tax=Jannaschia sp. M317 TaxID=2867011 RepID=UPI0021A57F41|nr:DUF2484 family protein [Jannaschia sp. M317]UWQ17180.1 DUF2484 family protein [Jannaschia sp. M317]
MALIALCLWVVLAWVLMLTLTARQSWPAAYGLIALGVPLVIWLGVSMDWLWAGVGVLTMGVVLRWPVRYAWRWVRARAGR